jgi:hypothetical protein
MVSVLNGGRQFTFPSPIPLEKHLKDVLEPEVDDKYVISENSIENFLQMSENYENCDASESDA